MDKELVPGLICVLAQMCVDSPCQIQVEYIPGDPDRYIIQALESEVGQLIGKEGKNLKAIRHLVNIYYVSNFKELVIVDIRNPRFE